MIKNDIQIRIFVVLQPALEPNWDRRGTKTKNYPQTPLLQYNYRGNTEVEGWSTKRSRNKRTDCITHISAMAFTMWQNKPRVKQKTGLHYKQAQPWFQLCFGSLRIEDTKRVYRKQKWWCLFLYLWSLPLSLIDESHLLRRSRLTVEDLESEQFKVHDPCVAWLNGKSLFTCADIDYPWLTACPVSAIKPM